MEPEDSESPEFAVGLRGYDRDQVDEYVAALRTYLDEAHERALAAEAALAEAREPTGNGEDTDQARIVRALDDTTTDVLPVQSAARVVAGLSDRVAEAVRAVVSSSEHAAQGLLAELAADREAAERARAEAERSRAEAERRLTAARAEAEQLLREAREQQAAMLASTEEHVTALRQQADQQQARRDDVLRQLAAVRTALEAAALPEPGGTATVDLTAVTDAIESGARSDPEQITVLRQG